MVMEGAGTGRLPGFQQRGWCHFLNDWVTITLQPQPSSPTQLPILSLTPTPFEKLHAFLIFPILNFNIIFVNGCTERGRLLQIVILKKFVAFASYVFLFFINKL